MSNAVAGSTRWGVVAVLVAAGIVAALQVGKVPPLLPDIRAELDLGLVASGWIASLSTLTGALLGLAAGLGTDRIGARRVLLACLLILAAGSVAGTQADDGLTLALSRVLESLGLVGVVVAAPRLIVSATAPGDQGLALGIWGTYMPAGMAAVMFAAPLFHAAGWRSAWLAGAIIIVLAALVAWPATRGLPQGGHRAGRPQAVWKLLLLPGPWLLAGCFICYTAQWFAVMSWLPTFMIEAHGEDAATAARMTALVVAANIPGNLAAAWALHRGVARWQLVALAFVAMAVAAFGIFSSQVPDAWRLPAAVAFSGIGGLLPSALLAGAPWHAPSPAQIAAVSGFVVQGANTGSLLGPPVTAVAVAWLGGWQQAHWLLIGLGMLGLVLTATLGLLERRQAASR